MLPALMTHEVVFPGEASKVAAARVKAAEGYLRRAIIIVFVLVSKKVFWVQKTLSARRAPVRPLRAIHVRLLVTAGGGQYPAKTVGDGRAYFKSHFRSNALLQPSALQLKPPPGRGASLLCAASPRDLGRRSFRRSPGV
jgi:hypothetical protein